MSSQTPLDTLIKALARLPGIGPRSARRIALHMLTNKDAVMMPLAHALQDTAERIRACHICGNLDTSVPCRICEDSRRADDVLCVIATVGDLWAIERTRSFRGRYHVLGGVLSALEGIRPEDLRITPLLDRVREQPVAEVIIALGATVDGQTTTHYLSDRLHEICDAKVTKLAHGMPVGGELDYLDDGTISTALRSRA